jgi:hypothetical protein
LLWKNRSWESEERVEGEREKREERAEERLSISCANDNCALHNQIKDK